MSFASAHIKRLLPYHSYKVYLKALAKIVKSSAHIPNLFLYRSYKIAISKTTMTPKITGNKIIKKKEETPHLPNYLRTIALMLNGPLGKKKENWDTESQMSIASAHIKRLLPYHSCKVYPKAWSEMTRSSARIPNLLPYHSYRVAIIDA
ncbi:hypothetical protein Glove_65g63 [Diversispora epigaea]|uniref:Uncharacterized protein n=1 Tax=Diversispora epigaea TaxID=1348612 RepID=A0A397JE84_9GLOM|nr:hypothetical protein Glove_65g63 [Diversispora epigaea]